MQIEVCDLRCRVRLGCTKEERAYPQEVSFTLRIALVDHTSVKSDALEDTIDYMRVFAEVEELCGAGEYKLVEKLAYDVGLALKSLSPSIEDVEVSVRKKSSRMLKAWE